MGGLSQGICPLGAAVEKRELYFGTNRILILWTVLSGLLVVLTYYIAAWFFVGRDPPDGTICPVFAPPLGLPAACVRYLSRMAYDKKCFTAALIDMAVKGRLTIKEKEGQFTLRRTSDSKNAMLSSGENKILKVLLSPNPSLTLKNSNHKKISKAIEKLGGWLSEEYEQNLFFKNRWWLVPCWLLSILAIVHGLAAVLLAVIYVFA